MSKSNKATNAAVTQSIQTELDAIETVSGKIRFLSSKEYTRSAIAKLLGIRYQHVRNVMTTPLKRVSA